MPACSTFTPPKEKPVIEDRVGDRIGTLATTSERRIVLVDLKKDHFCSEPSPDVAEAINSSIRAAVDASAKYGNGADIKVSGEIARQLATSINSIFTRTQGIQLFRDGSFALCQARMNGDIKDHEFAKRYDFLLDRAVELIKAELPLVAQRITQQILNTAQAAASDSKAASLEAKTSAEAAAKSAESAKGLVEAANKGNIK